MNSERMDADAVDRATVDWFVHEVEETRPGRPDFRGAALSPKARSQIRRLERLWDLLGLSEVAQTVPAADQHESESGSHAYQRWLNGETDPATERATEARWRHWALAAVLVSATVLMGVYPYWKGYFHPFRAPEVAQQFATGIAQTKRVTLSDGSDVTLGAMTQIAVRYTTQRREITLERGEALFAAAKNPSRPFVVVAGAGQITAIGTAFDVERIDDGQQLRVRVVVKDGTVEVAPPPRQSPSSTSAHAPAEAGRWMPERVTKGQGINFDRSGPQGGATATDAESASAWMEGRLEYHHVPLQFVLATVSRYSKKPLVLGDEQIGDVRFTGIIFVDDQEQIDKWLDALPTGYPVDVEPSATQIVLHSRAAPDPAR